MGSYVLKVSVARIGSVGEVVAGEESSVVLGLGARGLAFLEVGERSVYFVVILV